MKRIDVQSLTGFAAVRGLIGYKKGKTVFFKTRFGIHTFFMKYPLDILILSNKNRVVVIKRNLQPNRVFFWNPFYEKVVELPEKTIEKMKIQLGDRIELLF